jgi:poly(3-hydroxybutyrate) depolymerase
MRGIGLLGLLTLSWAQSGRYWDSLFSYRRETVAYGQAMPISGTTQTLYADIYLPEPDTEQARPLVVFLYGGAYVSGSRRDSDIVHLARYFVRRGYVTACIDYRLGLSWPTATEWITASIRAVQDLKGFLRFVRRSVIVDGNPYGIDTNRIYVGGSSAGAFTALHAAYITSLSELAQVPQADTATIRQIGGLSGTSGPAGYSETFHGVFSLSGGILRTSWLQPGKVSAVIAMHGTGDQTAPYKSGLLPFINLPAEGGYNIDSAAAAQGLYHDLFTWVGAGHVPYGTQTSVNPTYMRDVEAFLRYHFYQWNSRFTAALPAGENSLSPQGPYHVYRLDGTFWGVVEAPHSLPPGIWILYAPPYKPRLLYRY